MAGSLCLPEHVGSTQGPINYGTDCDGDVETMTDSV